MWATLTAPRAHVLHRLPGGISQFFRHCVEYFTYGTCDLRAGVSLHLPGESAPRIVYGCVRIVVQDEKAHKFGTDALGAGAIKLCALCANVVSYKSKILDRPSNFLIPSTETDTSKFVSLTNEDIFKIQDKLAAVAATGNAKKLADTQTNLGFNYSPHGLLQRGVGIDVTCSWCFDWMHCYFVGGCFVKELTCLLDRLAVYDLGADTSNQYLQAWTWPRAYASAKDICNHHDDHRPSGDASSLLSSAPVLSKYLRDVVFPSGNCQREAVCGIALCRVLDLLTIANSGEVEPRELSDAIRKHLQLHLVAYGVELWLPKHHFVSHLGNQLARHKILPSCFLMERKHRQIKRFAAPRRTGTAFEAGLMEEVTCQHLYDLHTPVGGCGLYEPHAAPDCIVSALKSVLFILSGTEILSARRVYVKHRRVQVGDAVAFELDGRIHFGQVAFNCSVDRICFTCVSHWECLEWKSHFARCVVQDEAVLVRADCIIEPCVFKGCKLGEVAAIILPPKVRKRAKPV